MNFAKRLTAGEFYFEYKSQYYEFDNDGRYVDDWEVWHRDICKAVPFLNRVLLGCHGLLRLEEYKKAAEILDKVCRLEFRVVSTEDSDEYADFDDSPYTLEQAEIEGDLSVETKTVGRDWIIAVTRSSGGKDCGKLAKTLMEIFLLSLCRRLSPDQFLEEISRETFLHMEGILVQQIAEEEKMMQEKVLEHIYSHEKYLAEERLKRKKEILLNIQMRCLKEEKKDMQKGISVLEASWKQIMELRTVLGYERYIDDQWQIEEIGKICAALMRRDNLEQESWEVRRMVLADIVRNDYYDYYGCYDAVFPIAKRMCVTGEEFLVYADILDSNGGYPKEAAEIYHMHGRDDKYVAYLESHLGKECGNYVALVNYYKSKDDLEKARQVAEEGLQNCKDDLTELFIFILTDAKKNGDAEKYKNWYSSVKRRKKVDFGEIEKALQ